MSKELISSYPSDDASKIKKIAESINQRYNVKNRSTRQLLTQSSILDSVCLIIMLWLEEKKFMEDFRQAIGKNMKNTINKKLYRITEHTNRK